jgi:hypothetical protein
MCLMYEVWRYQRGNQNPYIEEEQTIYNLPQSLDNVHGHFPHNKSNM